MFLALARICWILYCGLSWGSVLMGKWYMDICKDGKSALSVLGVSAGVFYLFYQRLPPKDDE